MMECGRGSSIYRHSHSMILSAQRKSLFGNDVHEIYFELDEL